MRVTRLLLLAGITVPVLYFGTVFLCGWFTPEYSHWSQYASELGMAGAPCAKGFNGGILLTAIATIATSIGLYRAAREASPGLLWPVLSGVALALFGVGLVFGALFPMPDPRHGGFGLGMAVHGAPLFLALALWRDDDLRQLRRFLIAITVVMLAFFLVMMGIGDWVTRSNVGLFQRIYALTVFGWVGVASFALRKRPTLY